MKKLILAGITTALAGLVMAGPAGAATTYAFDIPAYTVSGATGSYHVVFTVTSSTTFNVTLNGNYDGTKIGPAKKQKHAADTLTFTFFDSLSNQVNVISGTG